MRIRRKLWGNLVVNRMIDKLSEDGNTLFFKYQNLEFELFGQIEDDNTIRTMDVMGKRIKKEIKKRKNSYNRFGDLQESRILINLIISKRYLSKKLDKFISKKITLEDKLALVKETFKALFINDPTPREAPPEPPDIALEDNRILLA